MKNSILKSKLVILVIFWIIGCEDSGEVKEVYPISNVNFHYLQASNKLFVSAQSSKNYKGSDLDSVMVLWKGVSSTNTADTIRLLDDGTEGDMISKDLSYSRKFLNDISIIKNVIPSSAKDSVFLSIISLYGSNSISDSTTFLLGNIRPKLGKVIVPSTVVRPTANPDPNIVNTVKFTVTAVVSDPNGLDDIKRVFFRSYNVNKDSLMNGGNPILLYDDGDKDSSGDLQKGDGQFSRTISITENALLGTYHWTFEAQDISSAYSDTVKKVLIVK